MMKIMMIFFYDFIYEEHPVPGLEYNVPALVRLWVEARIAGRCKDVHAARIQLKLLLLPRLFRPTIQTSCKTFQIHCLLRTHLCPNLFVKENIKSFAGKQTCLGSNFSASLRGAGQNC